MEGGTFDALKRRIYLLVLPALAFTLLLSFFANGQHSRFDLAVLPVFVLLLLGLSVAIYLRRPPLRLIESAIFPVSALLFLSRLAYGIFTSQNPQDASQIYLWAPIVYGLGFLVYEPRAAFFRTGLVYAAKAAILLLGLAVLPTLERPLEFLLTSGVLLGLLYVMASLRFNVSRLQNLLENMAHLAFHDALTEVPNRRQLEAVLSRELAAAERFFVPLTVILFDLDDFKRVNDSYGHHAGDYVLKTISQLFKASLRNADLLGRWGGEEFLIVAPRTDTEAAAALAERLRTLLADYSFDSFGTVTASFGVAAHEAGDTVAGLMRRADEALYRSKNRGKNRVEVVVGKQSVFDMPELACPFALNLHEAAEVLQQEALAWLERFKLGSRETLYDLCHSLKPGYLVGNLHPEAGVGALQALADWQCWWALYTRRRLERYASDPEGLRAWHASLIEILEGLPPQAQDDAFFFALHDLRERLLAQADAFWLVRFTHTVKEAFAGIAWEVENHKRIIQPPLGLLTDMRPPMLALPADTLLAESVGVPALASAEAERMERAASVAFCWAADLLSLSKNEPQLYNLVLSLQREARLPLEEAAERAAALHDEAVQAFLDEEARLPQELVNDAGFTRYRQFLRARLSMHRLYLPAAYPRELSRA